MGGEVGWANVWKTQGCAVNVLLLIHIYSLVWSEKQIQQSNYFQTVLLPMPREKRYKLDTLFDHELEGGGESEVPTNLEN